MQIFFFFFLSFVDVELLRIWYVVINNLWTFLNMHSFFLTLIKKKTFMVIEIQKRQLCLG